MITCCFKLGEYIKAKEYIELGESYSTTEYNHMIILAQKAELFLLEGNEKSHWKIQKKTLKKLKLVWNLQHLKNLKI